MTNQDMLVVNISSRVGHSPAEICGIYFKDGYSLQDIVTVTGSDYSKDFVRIIESKSYYSEGMTVTYDPNGAGILIESLFPKNTRENIRWTSNIDKNELKKEILEILPTMGLYYNNDDIYSIIQFEKMVDGFQREDNIQSETMLDYFLTEQASMNYLLPTFMYNR